MTTNQRTKEEEGLQRVIDYFNQEAKVEGRRFQLYSDMPDSENNAVYYDYFISEDTSASGLVRLGLRFMYRPSGEGIGQDETPSIHSLDEIRRIESSCSYFDKPELYLSNEHWSDLWVGSIKGDRIIKAEFPWDYVISEPHRRRLDSIVVGNEVKHAINEGIMIYNSPDFSWDLKPEGGSR